MKVFSSIFNPKSKCHNCQNKFGIHRRRKCLLCRMIYVENLFCKTCSIKIKEKGLFCVKRYCNQCHQTTVAPPVPIVSEIQTNDYFSREEVKAI